ncbi:hypothetical protein F5Y19DRAFT_477321 [Xylariaceae sp. FL1651]|nr:hypothetical protein F5Y19DRAFT_477321 [Xylariaceae sp. FL1651]
MVARAGNHVVPENEALRGVRDAVLRGEGVVCAIAARQRPVRWGVVVGMLDDLVELTDLMAEISWGFVRFYLWAARMKIFKRSNPERMKRAEYEVLGAKHSKLELDIEFLELD